MLRRDTCHELLILLGFDEKPSLMSVQSTILTTALDQLCDKSKLDIIQHLKRKK